MLYATEGVNDTSDLNKAMVGVASVWSVFLVHIVRFGICTDDLFVRYEGNPYAHACLAPHITKFMTLFADVMATSSV
jgi:hypothetical protein